MKWVMVMILTCAWIGTASAQQTMSMPGMTPAPRTLQGTSFARPPDAENADKAAMRKMMDGMATPYTGDPDRDFVVHMIPHHQGAIDMCQTELQYGVDPKIRQLCGRIVSGQQADIRLMQAWLARHPAHPANNIPQRIQWK